MTTPLRSLFTISLDIEQYWDQIPHHAKPYATMISALSSIHDAYGFYSGRVIVQEFLNNSVDWKGRDAQRIKSELKKHLKLL